MARRYGRNQRRKHRDMIDTLIRTGMGLQFELDKAQRRLKETEEGLQEALGGGWRMASTLPDEALLPAAYVSEFSDELTGRRHEGRMYEMERTVRLTIPMGLAEPIMPKIERGYRDQQMIGYRGLALQVVALDVEGRGSRNRIGDPDNINITARATAWQKGDK